MHATRIDASFPFHIHETADHLQNETREKYVSINFGSGFPCLGGGFRGSGHGSGAGTFGTGGSADRPGDMGFGNG